MMLEVNRLTKSFGGLTAVRDLDFKIEKGEILGLIGPNGAGKTTVFNLLTGIYQPDSGEIRFNEDNITGLQPYQICKKGINRTYQIVRPFPKLTILENVMVGIHFGNLQKKKLDVKDKASELLDFVGLQDKKNQLANTLALFEMKKLELARALATDPQLLLLDEAASGLNSVELEGMLAKIKDINEKGVTLCVVEHVMKFVFGLSGRIIVIDHGEKIAEGNAEEVSRDEKVVEAYMGKE